jgi:GNAT superfamily N-acetyltransferase
MDRAVVLAQYDREMRQEPPLGPGESIEREEGLVRVVGTRGWIAYSRLTEENAAAVVEREAEAIRRRGIPFEWKLYGHDRPAALARLLEANGFVADEPETLMVMDLAEPMGLGRTADGVSARRVGDRAGLEAAVGVSTAAFAPDPGWDLSEYLPLVGSPSFAAFVAYVNGVPASAGRLDMPAGRSFASLWGGGTVPRFRGAGIYRSLVKARAELARARGFRFLTVDARETSRPILERVGFQPLAPVVGWQAKGK